MVLSHRTTREDRVAVPSEYFPQGVSFKRLDNNQGPSVEIANNINEVRSLLSKDNKIVHVDKTSDYSRGNGDTEEEPSASNVDPSRDMISNQDEAGY